MVYRWCIVVGQRTNIYTHPDPIAGVAYLTKSFEIQCKSLGSDLRDSERSVSMLKDYHKQKQGRLISTIPTLQEGGGTTVSLPSALYHSGSMAKMRMWREMRA